MFSLLSRKRKIEVQLTIDASTLGGPSNKVLRASRTNGGDFEPLPPRLDARPPQDRVIKSQQVWFREIRCALANCLCLLVKCVLALVSMLRPQIAWPASRISAFQLLQVFNYQPHKRVFKQLFVTIVA